MPAPIARVWEAARTRGPVEEAELGKLSSALGRVIGGERAQWERIEAERARVEMERWQEERERRQDRHRSRGRSFSM